MTPSQETEELVELLRKPPSGTYVAQGPAYLFHLCRRAADRIQALEAERDEWKYAWSQACELVAEDTIEANKTLRHWIANHDNVVKLKRSQEAYKNKFYAALQAAEAEVVRRGIVMEMAAAYLDALGDNLLRNDADMLLDECKDPKDIAEALRSLTEVEGGDRKQEDSSSVADVALAVRAANTGSAEVGGEP